MNQSTYWVMALCFSFLMFTIALVTLIINLRKTKTEASKDIKDGSYEQGKKDATMELQVEQTAKDVKEIKAILKEFDFGEYKMRIKQLEMAVFGETKDVKST